jgi:methylmalonyl-CoA/ethylmalonyl-CoA epimerase
MILKIDHIGVAVRTIDGALPFWVAALGLECSGVEQVEREKVKVAFLAAGASRIELLEPTADDSPVAKHIAKRGPGIHHLTLEVDDLPALLERLRAAGVPVLGDAPRRGAEDRLVAFLHPKAAGGVLVELVAGQSREPSRIEPGSPVLLYLREPQDKLWGVLRRLDPAGVVVEGIDLSSFDDWVAQIERDEPSVVGPSLLFIPMGRLEKILLDRSSGHLPALAERFERRTGRSVQEVLQSLEGEQ